MSNPNPPRNGGPGPKRRQRTVSGRTAAWTAAGAAGLLVIGGVAGTASGAFGGGSGAAPAASDSSVTPTAPGLPDAAEPSPSASPSPKRTAGKPRRTAKPTTRAPRTTRPAKPKPTPTRSKAPVTSTGGGVAGKVIALVNKERAKKGCRAVTADAKLTKAAQRHSADMARRGFFSHTNPDGKDPGARITAAGFRWSTYGENIAKGQPTAASVMGSWMNSPGHKANILNCDFAEIGIGVVKSGGPVWTQVFGTSR